MIEFYGVCDQMGQVDTGIHQPRDEKITPYEAEPGQYTGPIDVMALSTVVDPQFLWGQLSLAFQMIWLAVIQNAMSQCVDTARGYKGSVLEDWRHDNKVFLMVNAQIYVFFRLN